MGSRATSSRSHASASRQGKNGRRRGLRKARAARGSRKVPSCCREPPRGAVTDGPRARPSAFGLRARAPTLRPLRTASRARGRDGGGGVGGATRWRSRPAESRRGQGCGASRRRAVGRQGFGASWAPWVERLCRATPRWVAMSLAPVGGVVLGSGAVVLDVTPTSEAVDDRPAARALGLPPLRRALEGLGIDARRWSEFGNFGRETENRW
jgi:hypothetical protein